jgi:hypothetical protein
MNVNFILKLKGDFNHTSMEIIYLCIYFILCSISYFSHFHFPILNFNLGFNPNYQYIILFFYWYYFHYCLMHNQNSNMMQWLSLVVLIICFLICDYYHVI